MLVLGPRGLIGRAVVAAARQRGWRVVEWDRRRLDLRTPATWPPLPAGLLAVVNCAGFTGIDEAERDDREAFAVNATAVSRLAMRCRDAGVPLVHLSCPEVFSGEASTPYAVDAEREPVSAFGRSKAAGEDALAASGARFCCVRTSWVYAAWGDHYVRSARRLLSVRPRLDAVVDRVGRPTAAASLASRLLSLAEREATGTFHAAGGGTATRFELAHAIAAHAGRAGDVAAVGHEHFPRPARRLRYAVLDVSTAEALLGPEPCWRETLPRVLDELDRSDPSESAARGRRPGAAF
ncbi:dTDP-4-dehydrorhamnose reductase [Phycisphaera mikurensis NBRC 102666]|uniref:dTDP-4-dehydrorhamnose reductase n=1 Tax=Phycisphaera mikurensis (strain NBRC 102666 / KCTC 22515 / FYK2301M01) TaxID=1142394 RepID=I0IHS0_PHYMF|nr:dTDP-4-dehydrorhamnose reductase [Phycisphaera mikurensis NBRC 102666]